MMIDRGDTINEPSVPDGFGQKLGATSYLHVWDKS
jgi:hypothetical protein